MAKNIVVWFDEDADFLELSFGSKKKGFFREIKDDVFERVDNGGNITGFALFNFMKREKKEQKIALPVDVVIRQLKKKRSSKTVIS